MRYFNPLAKEIASKRGLAVLLDMSVPDGTGKIGDWWLLHGGERPYGFDADGQRVAEGEIVFADGRYVQTYVLEGLPEEAAAAAELRRAKERRALSVPSAVVEIDGLVSNASLDSIYRMDAALFAAQLDAKPDSTVVQWAMADNVVRTVSLRQLSAAYVQAAGRLVYDWPEVYTELDKQRLRHHAVDSVSAAW